jgi:hypothetical protein
VPKTPASEIVKQLRKTGHEIADAHLAKSIAHDAQTRYRQWHL